jgi:hypothetical protein
LHAKRSCRGLNGAQIDQVGVIPAIHQDKNAVYGRRYLLEQFEPFSA